MTEQRFYDLIELLEGYNDDPNSVKQGESYNIHTRYLIKFLRDLKNNEGLMACEEWLSKMLILDSPPETPNIHNKSSKSASNAEMDRLEQEMNRLEHLSENYKPGSNIKSNDLGWSNKNTKRLADIGRKIEQKNIEKLAKVEFWKLRSDLNIILEEIKINRKTRNKIGRPKDSTTSDRNIENEGINYQKTDIPKLIEVFALEFEKNTTKYTQVEITKYLKHWERFQGLPNSRSRAKREANLKFVADGTLSNWEKKWIKYRDLRTGN